jgi:CheY-like chemotaxis protein
MNSFSTPNIEADYTKNCREILMENTQLDLVMVTDRHANIVAKAIRQQPQSSMRQLSAEEIVKTALRTNIAKGAFNVSRNTTGKTSNIHVQYNAMDIIMYPLENDITLIAIGMVDSSAIPDINSSIGKHFPMNLKKAMIVDDEEDIRSSIREVLRKRGFDVEIAESGPACINAIENAKHKGIEYGIVMMDIRMPGMDGFEAYKNIHLISPNTKVIFITAFEYSEKEVARKVQNDNVKVLRKPFTRAELLQLITNEMNAPTRE